MPDPIIIELELFQECAIVEPLDSLDQILAKTQELVKKRQHCKLRQQMIKDLP